MLARFKGALDGFMLVLNVTSLFFLLYTLINLLGAVGSTKIGDFLLAVALIGVALIVFIAIFSLSFLYLSLSGSRPVRTHEPMVVEPHGQMHGIRDPQ